MEEFSTKSARFKKKNILKSCCGFSSLFIFHVNTFGLNARKLETKARTFKCLWGPGIDSKEWIPPAYVAWAGIFKKSMYGG